jgi:hypothetical protein
MKRLAAVAVVLAVSGLAVAADDKANPTGTWKWTVMGGGGGQAREVTLKLKMEGDKLTGAMVGRNNMETAIEEATFKGGEISFKVTRERQGQKFTTKYSGKLTGDTIKGKMEMPGREGGQGRTVDWEAKRAKSDS